MELSHAIFAAGCFWGVQAAFDAVDGVVSTLAGYTGGTLENPSYERICRGDTNHAEAVLVNFDETIVSYDKLLDIYFASHNPTTLNRQGPDIGTQYRSAIFTANEEQEAAALAKIRQINESGIYRTPVVTQVLPEQTFYRKNIIRNTWRNEEKVNAPFLTIKKRTKPKKIKQTMNGGNC